MLILNSYTVSMKFNVIIFIVIYFILYKKNQLTLGRELKNNRYDVMEYSNNKNIINNYPHLTIVNKRKKRYYDWLPDYDPTNLDQTNTSQELKNDTRLKTKQLAIPEIVTPTFTTEYVSDIRAILWSSAHDIYKPIRSKVEHKTITSNLNINKLRKILLDKNIDEQILLTTTSKIIPTNTGNIKLMDGLRDNPTKENNYNNYTFLENSDIVESTTNTQDLAFSSNSIIKLETKISDNKQINDGLNSNATKELIPLIEAKSNLLIMRNETNSKTNETLVENRKKYQTKVTPIPEQHYDDVDKNQDIAPTTYRNVAIYT